MAAGQPGGLVGVAVLDGLGDATVRLQHLAAQFHRGVVALADCGPGPGQLLGVPDALQDSREHLQGGVARGLHQLLVEVDRQRGERDAVLDLILAQHAQTGQLPADRRMVTVPGGLVGAERLQQVARGGEILEGGALRVQQQADVIGGRVGRGVGDDRPAALAAPDRQQSLGLQNAERLAQARPADGELLEEHGLGRQLGAVGQVAVENPRPQLRGDRLRDRRVVQRARAVLHHANFTLSHGLNDALRSSAPPCLRAGQEMADSPVSG